MVYAIQTSDQIAIIIIISASKDGSFQAIHPLKFIFFFKCLYEPKMVYAIQTSEQIAIIIIISASKEGSFQAIHPLTMYHVLPAGSKAPLQPAKLLNIHLEITFLRNFFTTAESTNC